jgi:hypothetical protein
VNLVETPDAHHKGQLGLGLNIEATTGLGLTLQADGVLLLQAKQTKQATTEKAARSTTAL